MPPGVGARWGGLLLAAGFGGVGVQALAQHSNGGSTSVPQEIPRTFDPAALVDFEVPPPDPDMAVEHISPEYYYSIPERVIYETHPMYHPDVEPAGYLDSLRSLQPRPALDTDTLDTDEEWVRAGELVFDAPQIYLPVELPFGPRDLVAMDIPFDRDSVSPFQRYVVVAPGDVRIGVAACGNCHTRVMPDGSLLKGAQGNFPFDWTMARFFSQFEGRAGPEAAVSLVRAIAREQYGAPWIDHPSQTSLDSVTVAEDVARRNAVPPGVMTRQGTHYDFPVRVPDLRGIRDRRYLDATGLVNHRSIGDLMRYAAFNQFVDHINRYGDFVPSLGQHEGPLPPADGLNSPLNGPFTRFADAQNHALARYLYSLDPAPSPHTIDAETRALAEEIFVQEGCVTCHPPPDFTNNMLTPALGFVPPDDHFDRFDVFEISVETDPGLALYTRRGTGYYKVPSLRGLWYRDKLLHDGSLTTLDELFDPARLEDDFQPSGFRGVGAESGAVPGHPFGFEITPEAKRALIAYLLTL